MIFRVVEKLGINRMMGDGWLQYIVTVVLVLGGATVFAVVMQKVISIMIPLVEMHMNTKVMKQEI